MPAQANEFKVLEVRALFDDTTSPQSLKSIYVHGYRQTSYADGSPGPNTEIGFDLSFVDFNTEFLSANPSLVGVDVVTPIFMAALTAMVDRANTPVPVPAPTPVAAPGDTL